MYFQSIRRFFNFDCADVRLIFLLFFFLLFQLTFVEFNLNPSCDDYLLVKNGPSPKSPLIGRYCGTSVSDKASITSEESFLFLEFHSDSKNQGKGFKIQIEPTSSGTKFKIFSFPPPSL